MKFSHLDKIFFNRATEKVAQDLLGMLLIRVINNQTLIGKIIETECYTKNDPASHCYGKKTTRNAAMFGPVGHAYIYKIYGIHYGFNIVAYNEYDEAGGVLIRALEPISGIEHMKISRNTNIITNLASGPGKLTQAFNIDINFYGHNLMQNSELFIAQPNIEKPIIIQATPRIGITKAQDYLGRFIIKDNKWVTPHTFNKLKV